MQLHAKQRAWLKSALQTAHDEQKTVVVMTHHSVSPLSVSKKYAHFRSVTQRLSICRTGCTQRGHPNCGCMDTRMKPLIIDLVTHGWL